MAGRAVPMEIENYETPITAMTLNLMTENANDTNFAIVRLHDNLVYKSTDLVLELETLAFRSDEVAILPPLLFSLSHLVYAMAGMNVRTN